MAYSDCNHYIKTPMVYKSSEVSRTQVKGFKLFGFDQDMPHVWWNSENYIKAKENYATTWGGCLD